VLKSVSKSSSVLQNHFGVEPNERDGMSVIAFCSPGMWREVNGEDRVICKRNARARKSCVATLDLREAKRSTQETVGELSLKRATCASVRSVQTPSIASQSYNRPAISTSEFVMVPFGLLKETMLSVISCGHCTLNTVGGISLHSPTTTPPAPKEDASVIPI